MQTYYFVLFVLSALLTGAYMLIWKKHYDVHLTLIFGVIPVTNLGFLLQAQTKTTEAALFATRFAYIGGCFLQLFVMLTIFSLCSIRVPKWLRAVFAGASAAVFLTVQTIGRSTLFYRFAELQEINGRMVLVKKYGVMHTVSQIVVITYFAISLGTILYSLIRKNQVSRKILVSLLISIM